MDNREYKHSVKKLLAFLALAVLAYILFFQLIALIGLYTSKEKTVFQKQSKEDAPIPAMITCWRTIYNLDQHWMSKYHIHDALFAADGNYDRQWKSFPWDRVSLNTMYEVSVKYPRSRLTSCQIGDNYSCTNEKGASHKWIDGLRRDESCSMLTTTIKVPYGQSVKVVVEMAGLDNLKLQDHRYSFSPYTTKHFYEHDVLEAESQFTVQKHSFLKNERKSFCSTDSDFIKCETDCIERYLMQSPSSCVMPWMTMSGPRCNNATIALEMIRREERLTTFPCNCTRPCETFQYLLKTKKYKAEYAFIRAVVNFDNYFGMVYSQEQHKYLLLNFFGNSAGSIMGCYHISLLWVLQKLVSAIVFMLKKITCGDFQNHVTSLTNCLEILVVVCCLSLFFYQIYWNLEEYIKNNKIVRVERQSSKLAPKPAVLICNSKESMEYKLYINTVENQALDQDYFQRMFDAPREYMIECKLDKEDCILDEGESFDWSTFYTIGATCNLLTFNKAYTMKPKQLNITFSESYSSVFLKVEVSLIDEKRIPKYAYIIDGSSYNLTRQHTVKIAYDLNSIVHLSPCTEKYQECLDHCWEKSFLNYSVCTPFNMPQSVKYQPCQTLVDYQNLFDYSQDNREYMFDCDCLQPCTSLKVDTTATEEQLPKNHNKHHLELNLLPMTYTKISDEWKVNMHSFLADIGGLLGIITGASLLQIGFLLLPKLTKLIEKMSSYAASRLDSSWRLVAFGLCLSQVFISCKYYTENPVKETQQLLFRRPFPFPEINICLPMNRFTYSDKRQIDVYNPGDVVPKVLDLKKGDYEWHWNNFNYSFSDYLVECSFFGISCLNRTGPLHEWKPVPNVNGYCSRLEIKLQSADETLVNDILFKYENIVILKCPNDGEEPLSELQDMVLDKDVKVLQGEGVSYKLNSFSYERLEEIPGNCKNDLSYSQNKCWSECLNNHFLSRNGCYYPWKTNVTGYHVCQNPSDYNYKQLLGASFLYNCGCPTPCRYKRYTLDEIDNYKTSSEFADITIRAPSSEVIVKEVWAYPGLRFVAELGGLMFLFTGLTVQDILVNGPSFLQSVGNCCINVLSYATELLKKRLS